MTQLQRKIPPTLRPHYVRWAKCRQCVIGSVCNTRIFYRGASRCDLLFVGDAPTDTDIALGEPFADKAGQLLDKLIIEAGLDNYKIGFTNTIVCVPANYTGGRLRNPKSDEIKKCNLRLNALLNIVKPRHIVSVGGQAEKGVKLLQRPYTQLFHPNKILMMDENGEIEIARAIMILKKVKKVLDDVS